MDSPPSTEQRHPQSGDLGAMGAAQVVRLMDEQEWRTLAAVRQAAPAIVSAAERVAACIAAGRKVVLLGSGTSGRLAVQEVAELRPTFGVSEWQFLAFIAAGPSAGAAAITRSEDDEQAAPAALVEQGIGSGDVVVGVAASGTTPFVVAGLRAARAAAAWTCGIANNPGTPVLEEAQLGIYLATGPEVLTGSTRLQAATAQKLALNRITTAAMVLNGRVVENHMVDVMVSIAKLERRAMRIVADLADIDENAARTLLESNEWRVREALAAASRGPADDS
jgi:N-acetylmuramic acid 6-phosphate etherase